MKEALVPAQETVFNEIMNGTTAVDTQISTDERRKKTFAFISTEAKTAIQFQLKQLYTNMNALEQKHYQKKMNELCI